MEHPSAAILGASDAIASLREQAQRLAKFDAIGNPYVPTVLLQGETGTGKGLVARALHDGGPRARNPFVDVNCAAIPDNMLEAELFGFEAGAFTDARRAKPGLFEAASTGTLFLDEVDSLSLGLQAKLLKAIEEKSVRRLGAVGARRVDVKLIAATQRDLESMVADGCFRADFYHRLAVLVLRIPALRERRDDAVLLAEHFLREFARAHALSPRTLSDDAKRWLRSCPWPGNVRELSHLVERVTLLGPEGELDASTLEAYCAPSIAAQATEPVRVAVALADAPSDDGATAARVRDALQRSGGNVVAAARILGIGRNALRYRMRRLGIAKPSLEDLSSPREERPVVRAMPAPVPGGTRATTGAGVTTAADESVGWEQKRAATLAIDVFFPEPDDLAPRYEPWTAAARWKQAIADKLRSFGGVIVDDTTSRVTAAFGIPRALEQMPQRAVRAALALQHLVASAAPPRPELRVAAHLGDVRFDVRSGALALLAIGDTLALPERLLGHAGAGEVLVTARIARQVAQACILEPRPLKLGPRPDDDVTVYTVVAGRPRPLDAEIAAGDGALDSFVGRERELAALGEAFRAADAGHGQAVFVTGEAGLGKSRLLRELRRTLDADPAPAPHVWLEGRCAPYGAATPFLPIVDGLRRFLGIDDHDDEASAGTKIAASVAALGPGLDWTLPFLRQILSLAADADGVAVASLDSASRRSETFRALRTILLRAAEQRCVVLVVEDLHWIDRTSEEFLGFVADVLATQRVLLLCSHRDGYAHPFGDRSYYLRLGLRPLSDDDMAIMTRCLLGTSDMPAALQALVVRKAEGNPFFVEEVTRSLLEDGSLRRENGAVVLTRDLAEVSIPDTIQDVLTARIDRLADDARHAIQVASVIGREFALRLLERISEAGADVHLQLDELRAVELIHEKALHPELAYMFKHALTHDVAYQSVLERRRRALHRTIGLAIEELYADRLEEHYETLAHHFARAEEWQRALDYHRRAADKAADQHATQAVVAHCRQALAIADRLGDAVAAEVRRGLEARLGLACFYLSDFAASAEAFERAAAASSDPDGARLDLGRAGLSYFWAHDYEHARSLAESVLAAGDSAGRAPRALALTVRGLRCAVHDADLGGAAESWEAALRLSAGHVPDAEALVRFHLSQIAEWTGDYRNAIQLAQQVMKAGRELRLAHLVVWPSWFLGKAYCCLGEYGTALAQLEEAHQICDRIGDRAWRSRLLNTLGWCLAEIGSHDRARECNLRSAALGRQLGDPEIVANAEINLAINHIALGRFDDARSFLEPIEDKLSRPGDPWMRWRYTLHAHNARAALELARRSPQAALEQAEQELDAAVQHNAPKLEARALTTAGRSLLALERWEESRDRLERALQVAERLGSPRTAWRAHGVLSELHQRRGRDALALKHAHLRSEMLQSAARSLTDGGLQRQLVASAMAEREDDAAF